MANHRSALKRVRQTKTRTERNSARIGRIRTFIKKFIAALKNGNGEQEFQVAQSEIQRGVTKGVLHKNTAARKISRLNKMLKVAK